LGGVVSPNELKTATEFARLNRSNWRELTDVAHALTQNNVFHVVFVRRTISLGRNLYFTIKCSKQKEKGIATGKV